MMTGRKQLVGAGFFCVCVLFLHLGSYYYGNHWLRNLICFIRICIRVSGMFCIVCIPLEALGCLVTQDYENIKDYCRQLERDEISIDTALRKRRKLILFVIILYERKKIITKCYLSLFYEIFS